MAPNSNSNEVQNCPVSSGDTLVISDIDTTMRNVTRSKDANHCQKIASDSESQPSASSAQTFADPNNGLEVLGRGVKELFHAVKELRHLGIEDLVLPLPKIVVVGDQSTGKSSLIEGISGIKVPRDVGTCTRCPLEINLMQNDDPEEDWKCQVSLVRKYRYDQASRSTLARGSKSEGATRGRPLGPWTPQDIEDLPFAEIASVKDVEMVLRLAQSATLNPSRAWEAYLPGNPQSNTGYEVKFSPNVIRLDISGPELANLSFYDLPGVINDTGNANEEYLVTLVKNLVKDYVKGDDCINLLALAMTDDPQNSSASTLIRGVAKAKDRTMGVLTKPDRLQEGEPLDQWIDILEGNKFEVGFGYFVVKNNSDPNVDHPVARAEEQEFFNTNHIWAIELEQYAGRFGTYPLQTALSQKLEVQIRASLPKIFERVSQKAASIDTKLLELPESEIKNPQLTVWTELTKLATSLEKHLNGGSGEYPFQKAWDDLCREFQKALIESAPKVRLTTTPGPNGKGPSTDHLLATPTSIRAASTQIDISDDETGPAEIVTPIKGSSKKRSCPSNQSTPSKAPRRMSEIPRYESVVPVSQTTNKTFNLLEIRSLIRDAYIGIQGQTHPKTIEGMIKSSMSHWDGLLERFLGDVKSLIWNLIRDRVRVTFERRQQTQFYEQVLKISEVFLNDVVEQQTQMAKLILRCEQHQPRTLNDRSIYSARERAHKFLQQSRLRARATAIQEEQEKVSGRLRTEEAKMKDLEKIIEAENTKLDEYSQEVDAMAKVKGYYECASSRFVDIVCLTVHCQIFEKCRDDMVSMVRSELGVSDDGAQERCALLLTANPEDEQLRRQLVKERETIRKAEEHLQSLLDNEMYD